MSVIDTVSRPYAQAIFEIAVENNLIEEWKKKLIFISAIASCKKVKKFLSGSLSPKYLSSIFISICEDILDEDAKNFIRLLAENQRLELCNNILQKFLRLEEQHKNFIIVELKSAFILKEKQVTKIRKILEESFLKKIKFIYKVDPYILDGFIIKLNDTIFDLSVKNHLKQLSNALNLYRE